MIHVTHWFESTGTCHCTTQRRVPLDYHCVPSRGNDFGIIIFFYVKVLLRYVCSPFDALLCHYLHIKRHILEYKLIKFSRLHVILETSFCFA